MTKRLRVGWGCVMLVCTLVRPVVSACEWGGMLAGTLVYQPGSEWDRTGPDAWVQDWWTHVRLGVADD